MQVACVGQISPSPDMHLAAILAVKKSSVSFWTAPSICTKIGGLGCDHARSSIQEHGNYAPIPQLNSIHY